MESNRQHDDDTQAFVPIVPGACISHYSIVSKIGEGGMGEVFLAEDNVLKRQVALKFLPPHLASSQNVKARFFREAQTAASLSHPNVITIHEVAEVGGRILIAMEYVKGQSLEGFISSNSQSPDEMIPILLQVCDGLAEAHEAGLVHRDIKPSNIMVDESNRVRILDFGLAKMKDDVQLTQAGTAMGTVNYMSPEQSMGKELDHRSDIFSVGILIYEMFTGTPPFKRSNFAATLNAICTDQPKPVCDCFQGFPSELQRIIDRALAKEPASRYQNISDLADDLRRFKKGRTPTAVPMSSLVSQAPQLRSLAVLYLRNLGTADDEHLCYGVTEDLIVDLSRIGTVRVAPMRTILKYRHSEDGLEEIAARLDVSMILDGSITRSEEGVRVAAQLVDIQSGATLWAERWEETNDKLPKIKQDLAREVATALSIESGVTDRAQVGLPESQNAEAYEYYLRGKYTFIQKKSLSDVEVALGLYRKAITSDPSLIAARAGIAEILIHKGDYDQANEEIIRALEDARTRGLRADESAVLRLLAQSHLFQSQWDESWSFGNESIEISKALGDVPGEIEALGILIDILSRRARFDEALCLFERVLQLNRKLNDRQSAAEALKNMGTVHVRKGDYDLARSFYEESQQIARKQGDTSLEADCIGNIGLTLFHTGEFSEALRQYGAALDIHTELGNQGKIALWSNNIAMVYESRGEYRKALASYERASEIHRELGNRAKYALTKSNCVALMSIMGDHERGIELADEAIAIAQELGFPMVISATNDSLGLIHQAMGNPAKAKASYSTALEVAKNAGLRLNEAYAHCNIAELHYINSDMSACKDHCTKALAASKEMGIKEVQTKASSYSAAMMARDGLFGAGVRKLRTLLDEARALGDPRYTIGTMRLLGQTLIDYGTSSSDVAEGKNILNDALKTATENEINYEVKWLNDLISKAP